LSLQGNHECFEDFDRNRIGNRVTRHNEQVPPAQEIDDDFFWNGVSFPMDSKLEPTMMYGNSV
jgi:hypothetical protein